MDLKNISWGEFEFTDIFIIKKGFYNKKPNSTKGGKIPFLGATQNNNGITEFYTIQDIENSSKIGYGKNEDLSKKIFDGNCIAVTNNGSVGFAYYQDCDFTCSHDINPLYLKNYTLNSFLAKFFITAIEMQKICFEYARKWRPTRMIKSKILLPTTQAGKPDYAFMEEFMRKKEQEKQEKFQNYIQKRIEEVKDFKEVEPLEQKEWREFFLKNVFPDIKRGKRLKKDDHIKGKMPYVSSSSVNNGIDGFVGNKEKVRTFEDCLSIANSGSVGATFYQSFPFVASDHITHLKNDSFNEFIYIFIATITSRLSEKYSFNREINDPRIKREKILLPINNAKEPDYGYMENYIKRLEYRKLSNYLKIKAV